eukprot:14317491-Heterocapsa_arctica.AAC.1
MEAYSDHGSTPELYWHQETASFVERRMLELTICGGIAEHSTYPRTLVISNSCKSDTKSTTNLS